MDEEFAKYLERIKAHRAELHDSLDGLNAALAGPIHAPGGVWRDRVHAAFAELDADFREHVELTEGPGGLYDDIRQSAPRLAPAADRLTQEHVAFQERLDAMLAVLDSGEPIDDLEKFREEGTQLIGRLVRHRQHGSDMVFEAYEVDLGGSG